MSLCGVQSVVLLNAGVPETGPPPASYTAWRPNTKGHGLVAAGTEQVVQAQLAGLGQTDRRRPAGERHEGRQRGLPEDVFQPLLGSHRPDPLGYIEPEWAPAVAECDSGVDSSGWLTRRKAGCVKAGSGTGSGCGGGAAVIKRSIARNRGDVASEVAGHGISGYLKVGQARAVGSLGAEPFGDAAVDEVVDGPDELLDGAPPALGESARKLAGQLRRPLGKRASTVRCIGVADRWRDRCFGSRWAPHLSPGITAYSPRPSALRSGIAVVTLLTGPHRIFVDGVLR